MVNIRLTAFPAATVIDPANDPLGLVDVSDLTEDPVFGTTKKATPNQIVGAVKLDDMAAPDDNTDLNASTAKHGLLPKGNGVATDYLDGTIQFTTPAGGGGSAPPFSDATEIIKGDVDTTKRARFEADTNVPTSTTVVLTLPATDIDLTPGTGSFAAEAEGVTNGNAHNHDAGDGAAIPTAGLDTDAVTTAKIQDGAATYAKIQNVSATDRFLGRDTAGAGVVEEIAPAAARTILNVEDGAAAPPYVTADISAGAITTALLATDAVQTAKVEDAAVTYAKMQDVSAAARILGRASGAGAGDVTELTAAQVETILSVTFALQRQAVSFAALRLVDMGLQNAPAGKVDGDAHVVGPTPGLGTDWELHANKVAIWRVALSAWDFHLPADGMRGRVTAAATHHFARFPVAYDAGTAEWHPLVDAHITTEHFTGKRSKIGNEPVYSKSFSTQLEDHGAGNVPQNIPHGVTLDATTRHIFGEGSMNNGAISVKIPQNFSAIVVEVRINASNLQIWYGTNNLTAYTAQLRMEYTK